MIYLFLFIFGLIVGSFLNVAGLRYRSGLTLGGRSACPSCSKQLKWWELLPVASFFMLGGKCSACRTKISWQYPLVELWTGFVFVSLYSILGFSIQFALAAVIFAIYTVILIYDMRHKIIPDELAYACVALALVFRLTLGGTLIDWLVGPVLFLLFFAGWLISRGRALGLGDAKLSLSVGLLLGGAQGLSAIALAFWIGTAVTLPLVLLSRFSSGIFSAKKLTIKSEIPFAPFIIVGALASLLFQLDLLHVLSFTS